MVFDLSEVYLKGMYGIGRTLQSHLKRSHHNIHMALFFSKHTKNYFHGKISEDTFWANIIKENRWDASVDYLKSVVRANFEEIPGTRDIIEKLGEKGYKLGLLSVNGREWIEYCESRFDYHKLFDKVMYSYQVGVSKPDARAYQLILKELDSKPGSCLFVDDSKTNITAAKRLGMNAIRFKNSQQLRGDLRNCGIEV
jgi:epoxide hydrolase-like predicted phosphatase